MFLGIAIYTLLTGYVSSILSFVFPRYETIDIYGQSISYNTSFVGFLYEVLLIGAFMYGLALFMLTFFRTKRTDNKLLFEGFSMLGKTILLQIVTTVFIFLWSLLFIIPGIIAAYRYRMAKLFLLDHPDAGVMDSIRASKEMMKGHKWECFVLDLSFIGWWLLAAIPYIGYAVSIWVTPYINTTYVLYYMALAGKPVTVGPAPSQNPYM